MPDRYTWACNCDVYARFAGADGEKRKEKKKEKRKKGNERGCKSRGVKKFDKRRFEI